MAKFNRLLRYSVILIVTMLMTSILHAKTIMILGDSISAGYGLQKEQGWVHLLQQRLNQKYPKQHQVINASVSGETTSGALARLPKLLTTHQPDIIVIELGGNDGLRGQPPQQIQQNLSKLVQLSKQHRAKVIIFGMKIPPNYGKAYSQAFENNYSAVAKQHQVALLPFFLEGVATQRQLMQQDLIHPNAQAQPKLLNLAWKYIDASLK